MSNVTSNPFDEYFLATGDDAKSVAKKAKCSVESIYKYANGTRTPRNSRYKKLSDAMNGFYSPERLKSYFENAKQCQPHA